MTQDARPAGDTAVHDLAELLRRAEAAEYEATGKTDEHRPLDRPPKKG